MMIVISDVIVRHELLRTMHMQLCDNARITPLHKSRRDFSNKIFGHGAVTLGTAYVIAIRTQ